MEEENGFVYDIEDNNEIIIEGSDENIKESDDMCICNDNDSFYTAPNDETLEVQMKVHKV